MDGVVINSLCFFIVLINIFGVVMMRLRDVEFWLFFCFRYYG